MATLPLTLSVETSIGLRGVLPPRGTFPISNLIPGPILGFSKTRFSKNYGDIFFLGFISCFIFPSKIKIKISGDSNFFSKINFSQIKKRVSPIEWGRTWKMRVHRNAIKYFNLSLSKLYFFCLNYQLNCVW